MLLLKTNQLNKIVCTVSQNAELATPEWLFSFTHKMSKERVTFILPNISTHKIRYDEFEFIEGQGVGEIAFPYEGQYIYGIYEQYSGSTNLNPALAYNKVESGLALLVAGSAMTTNDYYIEFISNDEDNSNIIFAPGELNPPSPTPSITASPTQTPSQTATNTPSPTQTPSMTQTVSVSNTATQTPTVTSTPTRTPSQTPTQTPTNTASNTPTQTQTKTPTQTPTQTRTPSQTPTQTPTNTASNTPTQTQTKTPTQTATSTQTPSVTPTQTATPTLTTSVSNTPTQTGTLTPTPSITASPTHTPTPSITASPTNTPTPSVTATQTQTQTNTPTPSITASPTNTPTPSITSSPTNTPTPSVTPSQTQTQTPTQTNTPTPSITASPTNTPTPSITASPTNTPTPSVTATQTNTPTNTKSPTPTPTMACLYYNLFNNSPSGTITVQYTACDGGTVYYTLAPQESYNVCSMTVPIRFSGVNSLTVTPLGICPSPTPSPTVTPSITPTNSPTPSVTATRTQTPTVTPTPSITPSATATPGPSPTPTTTPTNTITPTTTATNTMTPTNTPSPTAFSPSSLSPNIWVDFNDRNTITFRTGTLNVERITNKGTNATLTAFTQSVAADQPLWGSGTSFSTAVSAVTFSTDVLKSNADFSSSTLNVFAVVGGLGAAQTSSLIPVYKYGQGSESQYFALNRTATAPWNFRHSIQGLYVDGSNNRTTLYSGVTFPTTGQTMQWFISTTGASTLSYCIVNTSATTQVVTSNNGTIQNKIGNGRVNLLNFDGSSTDFAGQLGEVFIFTRELTSSERSDLNLYLKNKWGLKY